MLVRPIEVIQDVPISKDHRQSKPRMLIVLNRYQETLDRAAGAEMRQAGIVNGLAKLMAVDVLSIEALRSYHGCSQRCRRADSMCTSGYNLQFKRHWPYCDRSDRAFGQLLADSDYSAVLFSHVGTHQFIETAKEHVDTPVLVDFHNAEADLEREIVAHPAFSLFHETVAEDWSGMERVERLMFDAADVVLVPSPQDKVRLERRHPTKPIIVVPNSVPMPQTMPQEYEFVPSTCFFLGSLGYFPNAYAALQIIERIGPAIMQKMPQMRVQVLGRRPAGSLIRSAMEGPVRLLADVDDIRPVFRNSAMLVPLDCGGGPRLKILQAFAAGCSVISTEKGMEGISATPGIHYLLAEDSNGFVGALQGIAQDPFEDLRRRQRAWQLTREMYCWDSLALPLHTALKAARVTL